MNSEAIIDKDYKIWLAEFPGMKGFSKRNLELIRQWHLFYKQTNSPIQFAKQPVSQLSGIHDREKNQQLAGQIGQQVIAHHLPIFFWSLAQGLPLSAGRFGYRSEKKNLMQKDFKQWAR